MKKNIHDSNDSYQDNNIIAPISSTTSLNIQNYQLLDSEENIQLALFSQFLTHDPDNVSNTIELWDTIPKYFFTPALSKKLRTHSGHADPFTWHYKYQDNDFTVTIAPAQIKQNDGKYKSLFPGITEEFVEEALKKILSSSSLCRIHDAEKPSTWIKFSLKMIQKELARRSRARNINEIKNAIAVMSKCTISITCNEREIWSGSILQDLITIDRASYVQKPESYHIARLPLLFSQSINNLNYRQFNYEKLMKCNEQLSRWFYKKLVNSFTQANYSNSYHLKYSSIESSALLQQASISKNIQKISSALEELKNLNIIRHYSHEYIKQNRKIIDILYSFFPSDQFIYEQKAANKSIHEKKKITQKTC